MWIKLQKYLVNLDAVLSYETKTLRTNDSTHSYLLTISMGKFNDALKILPFHKHSEVVAEYDNPTDRDNDFMRLSEKIKKNKITISPNISLANGTIELNNLLYISFDDDMGEGLGYELNKAAYLVPYTSWTLEQLIRSQSDE